MPIEYTDCDTAKREHSWYRWSWSHKRSRYERECSTMGCETWQYLKGTVIASEPIVLVREDKEHVHQWNPWYPVDELHVEENRFYGRNCNECKAREETGGLKEIGETAFFPWQEGRDP